MFFKADCKALYIHIPFCTKKCGYCDFFSIESCDDFFIKNILAETLKQVDYFNKLLNIKSLQTIYIGGGTPTAIGSKNFEWFVTDLISMYNGIPQEFTVEANPETLTFDFLNILNKLPVTRLSLGIQSFNKKMLKIIGRNCIAELSLQALEKIRKIFDKNLSIDIISSIPGQSVKEAIDDVKKVVYFLPGHISLYYLTIEHGTPIAEKFSNNNQNDDCWIKSCCFLENAGYSHYEISNFALPDMECLHNLNYWRMKPYIGCGLSAVSSVYNNSNFQRITTTANSKLFLQGRDSLWGMLTEEILKKELFIDIFMMGLRTNEGVNLFDIREFFGIDIEKILFPFINVWKNNGFLILDNHIMMLTNKGRYFHSSFMVDFMNAVDDIDSLKKQ
jgi:oxygen-independent coproporphyrinogen-3 oxidase